MTSLTTIKIENFKQTAFQKIFDLVKPTKEKGRNRPHRHPGPSSISEFKNQQLASIARRKSVDQKPGKICFPAFFLKHDLRVHQNKGHDLKKKQQEHKFLKPSPYG